MTIYTAFFNTTSHMASEEIEAASSEEALAKARRIAKDGAEDLWFEPFDGAGDIGEILITIEDGEQLCGWYDEDFCLQLTARELLEAARLVLARWERGDLAEAVRAVQQAVARHDDLMRAANSPQGVRS